jgi:hypothetical protein
VEGALALALEYNTILLEEVHGDGGTRDLSAAGELQADELTETRRVVVTVGLSVT